ncbi:MAG: acetyl-CoA carboxylase biotin carboxyl carrier protein [Pirellulaceae bacterium]|jgi:acetyl-CoA carboxylase biotin carboxyl carrier protein|nr:acetyl-CoA carboxylase biotin carboxyl carrier protein [Pirellulaceae bacterium]
MADKGAAFDLDRIRALAELMKEHDLSEVDISADDVQIRLARTLAAAVPIAPAPLPQAAAPPTADAVEAEGDNIVYIKSPMVGTFYTKPNPESSVFIKVGDHVEPESTVCIVEAMKMFNEIPAELRGKVVAVLVDNESPVEFDQKLFRVDTSL